VICCSGPKQCRVSFRDADGIEHAVEVEARTLYEAVGLAIDRFRRCEHVRYEPKGLHEFTVEPREPGTQHRLTREMFDAWLRRPAGSPAEMALKTMDRWEPTVAGVSSCRSMATKPTSSATNAEWRFGRYESGASKPRCRKWRRLMQ
jgi:hypothetical protein